MIAWQRASTWLLSGDNHHRRASVTVLTGVILLLVVALIWILLRGQLLANPLTSTGGAASASIQPILGIRGPGTGRFPTFDRPLAAAFGPDGSIYVADTGHDRICVFDSAGRFRFEFGSLGVAKPLAPSGYTWSPGLMNYPSGIDVADNGDIYVADLRNDQIQVFGSRGAFLRRFPDPTTVVGKGGSGFGGRGIAVSGVAVDGGRVYAADTYQILEFDTQGHLISQRGKPGTGPGDLDHPAGIALSGDQVVVSDSNHARVVAFSAGSAPVWICTGGATSANGGADQLGLPRGVTRYGTGWLVADAIGQCLVQLDSHGVVVQRYGTRGVDAGQLNFPTGVDVAGDRVLIADKENNGVQVVSLKPVAK